MRYTNFLFFKYIKWDKISLSLLCGVCHRNWWMNSFSAMLSHLSLLLHSFVHQHKREKTFYLFVVRFFICLFGSQQIFMFWLQITSFTWRNFISILFAILDSFHFHCKKQCNGKKNIRQIHEIFLASIILCVACVLLFSLLYSMKWMNAFSTFN